MRAPVRHEHGTWRTSAVTFVIAGGLAAASLLALEAYRAMAYHRRTAQGVLRDYAALAAGEMVRRSSSDLGYYGYAAVAMALAPAGRVGPNGPSADASAVLDQRDGAHRRPLHLVRSAFTWTPGTGLAAEPRLAPEAQAWLVARLPSVEPPRSGYLVLHQALAGEPRTFVLARAEADRGLVGFEVDPEAQRGWFARAFARAPLLPPSLGDGTAANDAVSLVVRDAAGRERFRSQAREWPELQVDVPFGDAYEGVLEGSTVRVSLDPAAAPRLVVGGLPRARLAAPLTLLGLTAALLVTAIVLSRRERALQRLRADFVASVSHELRTPLTQIRMFAETLVLDRVRSPEEARRGLEIIDKEARRLTNLVENLLMFSRAERGAVRATGEPRDLRPLLDEIAEGFRPLLSGTETRLDVAVEAEARAAADPDAVRQIVLNLLDNAVKYGPRGQTVRLCASAGDGPFARIVVEDQGPGIPESERRRVFERFHRLDRDRDRAVAGTGIGLAVVRDLLVSLGGSCVVEAAAGGGTRVVVDVP